MTRTATGSSSSASSIIRWSQASTSASRGCCDIRSRPTRTISEYFEDTLATEPEPIVDFLLKTSILDQMNGSLCSAVAGTPDGAAMLEALEREQFVLDRFWFPWQPKGGAAAPAEDARQVTSDLLPSPGTGSPSA